MDKLSDISCIGINKIESLLDDKSNNKSCLYVRGSSEFNKTVNHIVSLLEDAFLLYKNKSYATSFFISVIAIEVVGKVFAGIFVGKSEEKVPKDPLRDHRTKQLISCMPTLFMGERLTKCVDSKRLENLLTEMNSGDLKNKKESALYWDRKNGELIVPEDNISKNDAKCILLIAIEIFDDDLVGFTNESISLSKKTDSIFKIVSES